MKRYTNLEIEEILNQEYYPGDPELSEEYSKAWEQLRTRKWKDAYDSLNNLYYEEQFNKQGTQDLEEKARIGDWQKSINRDLVYVENMMKKEKSLPRLHYNGDPKLKDDYEFLWEYMHQKEFGQAKKIMQQFNRGENVSGKMAQSAFNMINWATKELNRLYHEEYATTFSDLPKEKDTQIKLWCEKISQIYSPLKILIEN